METATPTVSFRQRLGYSALLLGAVAMLAGAALTFGHIQTADDIAARQAEDRLASLEQVVPAELHDNDMVKDAVTIAVGESEPKTFFRALRNGKVTAVAYEMTGQGYGGAIRLLMSVDANGTILGVRVLSHTETPGLGDKIDVKKTHWILDFNGHSLGNPDESGWHVKKDGGIFDQFTGATITPRAVVKTIHAGLQLFTAHRDELLAPSAQPNTTAEASHG